MLSHNIEIAFWSQITVTSLHPTLLLSTRPALINHAEVTDKVKKVTFARWPSLMSGRGDRVLRYVIGEH